MKRNFNKLKLFIIIVLLFIGLYIALSPNIVYAPTPKIILFFLLSFLPSLIFGAEMTSKFNLKLIGFTFTTTGACAVSLGTLLLLTNLSKPEQQIAVFQVVDENHNPVMLDWSGAIEIPTTSQGLTVTKFIDGNSLVLIFPEQVGEVEIQVKKGLLGTTYSGWVGYSGNRTSKLVLGKQLKPN